MLAAADYDERSLSGFILCPHQIRREMVLPTLLAAANG